MNELALFAGGGGGILAGHLLGWRTVCAVEPEGVPRVTQGMEFRADRLKAIGNGQFPLSAAIAFDLLSKQDDFF